MAKDDYDVIVYRILVYLYGCFKHEIMFEDLTFEAAVRKHVKSDEYFALTGGRIPGIVKQVLADMYYNDGNIDYSIHQTGRWKSFNPEGG